MRQQDEVLATATRFVRPGGRLVYVTCSVLPEENEERIAAFLGAHRDYALTDPAGAWLAGLGTAMPEAFAAPSPANGRALRLTPATAGTDGFFVAVLERQAAGSRR